MDILNKISLLLEEKNDFTEGELVDYEGNEWYVSHKENNMIEIVSKDETKRIKVLPSEIKKK